MNLRASDLADALGDWLEARWNNKGFFKRWYWRGWIIGYVIVEVLLTFFTAGVVELAKAAARATKLVSLVKKLSAVTKLTEAAKALKNTKAVLALTDAIEAARGLKAGRKALEIEKLIDEVGVAKAVEKTGKTPEELLKIVGEDSRHAAAIQDHMVDEAFAKLEKGQIPQHGEPRQFGRQSGGKPADPTKIPDVGRGVTRDLVARVRRIMGKTISQAPKAVQDAWADAAAAVQRAGTATEEGMLKAYKEAQKRFWKNVRANSAARAWFEQSGFWFDPAAEGAPYIEAIKGFKRTKTLEQELRLSLDHILEKAKNPALALDPGNLRFATHWDNWLLNKLGELLKKLPRP